MGRNQNSSIIINLFTFFICLQMCFLGFSQSQFPNRPVRLKVHNDDFSDLEHFGKAIGDKRIVLLDELTHGEGNIFSLKSRLVKYLHHKKGFDVFLFLNI